MYYKVILTTTIILLVHSISWTQIKIGSNHTKIHAASLLELESKEKVLVLTKVSQEEMLMIKPLNGAIVYNTTLECVHYYDKKWIPLCSFIPSQLPKPATFIEISPNNFLFTSSTNFKTWLQIPRPLTFIAGSKNNGYQSLLINNQQDTLTFEVKKLKGNLIEHNSIATDKLIPGSPNQFLTVNNQKQVIWDHLPEQSNETTQHTHEVQEHQHNQFPEHTHEAAEHTHETTQHTHEVQEHQHNQFPEHTHEAAEHTHEADFDLAQLQGLLIKSQRDSTNLNTISYSSPGAMWYANEEGQISDIKNANKSQLGMFWDAENARLGIGTLKPTNKMHVAGEIRSQGFSNSNGSQNEPSYSFKADSNTGMFRAAADQLAFSTKGIEAMRITKLGQLAVGKKTANATLDINGSIALAINHENKVTATITAEQTTIILNKLTKNAALEPASEENKGRIYILKNISGEEIQLNIYYVGKTQAEATENKLFVGLTWLQSDGTHWQQIN